MNKRESDFYKPIVLPAKKVGGIAGESANAGQQVKIITKLFTTSLDGSFEDVCNNLTKFLLGSPQGDSLNKLLALIKKDGTAYVYRERFPLAIDCRLKRSVKALEIVRLSDVSVIEGIRFEDAVFELNLEDGDKLVWLFRVNWRFGLFFDLSGKLEAAKVPKELGNYYRYLAYLNVYSFLDGKQNFKEIVQDGWFPFVQLIGGHFEDLIRYYSENKKYQHHIDKMLNAYTQDKVEAIAAYWWENPVFESKREILQAGIDAYFQDTKSGHVNAIKTLSTEIEGILRLAYFREFSKQPNAEGLKRYVSDRGKARYSSAGSLGFPGLFYDYLDESLFRNFDLVAGDIPLSRHSIAHEVASSQDYGRVRAFQLILALDQIRFFLGSQ